MAQYVNRTYVVPSLTSSVFPLSPSLCVTRNAEGHPAAMWIATVHLWVQLCPQCPLCMTHILSKMPCELLCTPRTCSSPAIQAPKYSRKLLILSLKHHTLENDTWCCDSSTAFCIIELPLKWLNRTDMPTHCHEHKAKIKGNHLAPINLHICV